MDAVCAGVTDQALAHFHRSIPAVRQNQSIDNDFHRCPNLISANLVETLSLPWPDYFAGGAK